ncbi:hypothetical protein [Nocardioides sp. CFH 31398]|uniref:DUF6885 family protein n=1 Tax=Nocardioides sp. CFH 31398 TaxID=2919579 RepID=UPI001F05787B|nr:hypothetical protein [Nocardioides sp. CFH 31398]MCH1867875.1 hypothetical protein [Nocardioides sp. CFH 31398]
MAVLTGVRDDADGAPDDSVWERLERCTGSEEVLAVQAAGLPQPDQLCGPFAARAALHAVLPAEQVPDLRTLALAAGTHLWGDDDPASRPPGVPQQPWRTDEQGGDLPVAVDAQDAGTDAAGLATGIVRATRGAVGVVPVRRDDAGAWPVGIVTGLLGTLAAVPYPVGVVANVTTGPLTGTGWDVGHFVVLWGLDRETGAVAVADSYAELTARGAPPGCHLVHPADLAAALGAGPGRGLLLLTDPEHAALLAERCVEHGLVLRTWRV